MDIVQYVSVVSSVWNDNLLCFVLITVINLVFIKVVIFYVLCGFMEMVPIEIVHFS